MIRIKTAEEIEKMRVAGALTADVLTALSERMCVGITTAEIDTFCHDYIVDVLKARPGSKGQYGYPYSVNTSPNKVVCHGMPYPEKVLVEGDIINVDITVLKDGYYGDSSKMFCIGKVAEHAKRLVDTTQECLYEAIRLVKPGIRLGEIGHKIQTLAESRHYSVVREFCGHGIGCEMHEDPQVLHYGKPNDGDVLKPGMTFTIEPMINQGKRFIKVLADGWTAVTQDKRLSAQWEHTLLVTETGVEILTLREEEKPFAF